jgi:YidC/Oxa1 family membrane protein insertase
MNQNRAFLLFAWVAVAILLAFEWTKFTATPPAPPAAVTAPVSAAPIAAPAPRADALPGVAAPPASSLPAPVAPGVEASAAPVTSTDGLASGRQLEVVTDVLRLRIDSKGGTLAFAELLKYPVDTAEGSPNVVLLNNEPSKLDVAQTGWITATGAAPGTDSEYTFEAGAESLSLADGQESIDVPLLWRDATTGLTVRKIYTVTRGSYAIGVRHEVINQGAMPFVGNLYQQLLRVPPPPAATHAMFTNPESFSFVGSAWYSNEDHFEKRKFDKFVDDGPLNKDVTGGWIAMLQHHFASVWLPPKGEAHRYSLEAFDGQRFAIRSVGQATTVAPGAQANIDLTLWVGPKLQAPMKAIEPTLPLALDYGIFSFLAQPLFWVLDWLHALFGNWGWAIIGIVVILKLLLYPLSAKQYQSMAKMRAVAPRLEQLKERYGEDKVKFNQAMMELYQKEKINPLGGCLPMLLPIPIFIALYWVLLESVELRQAPWALWIDNLTAPDPWFVLPALNLAVMWATQKLTPSPGMDPVQKKVLQWMPVVFGVMFAFFPAGLVLYWFTNGLLGLAQQWWMTKRYGETSNATAVTKAK